MPIKCTSKNSNKKGRKKQQIIKNPNNKAVTIPKNLFI